MTSVCGLINYLKINIWRHIISRSNVFSNNEESGRGYCFIHQVNNRNVYSINALLKLLWADNWKDYNMLESVEIISNKDYLDWFKLQIDSNNIYDIKFQTCNLDFQSAYKRYKPTIQVIRCSNSIPYMIFSNQYTNYILGTHYTYSSSRLWPFHAIIK